MATGRAGCADEPLELKAGDDVLVPLVSPFLFLLDGEDVVSGGKDCRSHLDLDKLVLGFEVDGPLFRTTGGHTQSALDTGLKVNGIDQGDNLRVVDIDGLTGFHPDFEEVWLNDRADCIAISAAVTTASDNPAGFCFRGRGHREPSCGWSHRSSRCSLPRYRLRSRS